MALPNSSDTPGIGTAPQPQCIICGDAGTVLYADLQDRLFAAPGRWTLRKCANKDCALLWLDPAPRRDELWKAYRTYYTHHDVSTATGNSIKKVYHFFRDCYLSFRYGYFEDLLPSRFRVLGLAMYLFPGRRADVDFSVMYLAGKRDGKLLEVGCGSGLLLQSMRSLGWQVEGIDVDPSAVRTAREKDLTVALGSLEEQNYQDDTFDAVVMSHVIEHVAEPQSLINECRRILKPGGTLSLVTPNTESFGCDVFARSWLALDPPRHLMLYNGKALRVLAERAGFSHVRAVTTIRDAHTLFWASYCIRKHGTFVMGTPPGVWSRWLSSLLRLAEWGLIKMFPGKGEEIAVLGIKECQP